ncbi:hypothetical protein O181_067208 [Austropuccinia psidii MF-1]|uniref:Uncharacterized protein n=1 Tax=Austropuccinia psidii MF-1 TaxID=1389203 RepID=A0A9Q3ESX2_9BASI|nr:hypothetical protein [Austropuccinia psidii MF-1]
MEHEQKEVQTSIPLGGTWSKFPEDMSQRDTLQRPYGNHQRMESHQEAEGLQECIEEQRVPDPCRSVEKLHEFVPDCERIPGPSQHLQVTQWMAPIDGKQQHDAFNSRMEGKQHFTTQASAKNSPSSQKQLFQHEKAATSSEQGQRKCISRKALQPGLQKPKDPAECHGKFISDGQKKEEARFKYQK